ncbi:MAG: pectate lyase, partial [Pseudomonadota bacterium]|nr:pectate lyase [Pseudomonadota bacterium]
VPAFPGAEGAGAMSLGGRGGTVLRVTNLDDSGPGSLRAAVEARMPRIVVFDVGGTIRLKTPLAVRHPRITIAGQTAPGGGITLRDQVFGVAADDVVVRFIRSRLGDESQAVADAIWITRGHRIILDHVSASWGTDEVLSISSGNRRPERDLGDVTVQWSIISESLCDSVNPEGRHCFGSLIAGARGARMSFHHNLWAHHGGRMPGVGNSLPPETDPIGGFFDLRSNVMYNWGGKVVGYSSSKRALARYNLIDNSYLTGPDSRGKQIFAEANVLAGLFLSGNTLDGAPVNGTPASIRGGERPGFLLRAPVKVAPLRADSSASANRAVLAFAGASLPRDVVDERVVASVVQRGGRLINSQRDVGGWPALARGTPWQDRDGDGMPDEWERRQGLNPSNAADGNRDADGNGYTNVEEWLNALAARAMPG